MSSASTPPIRKNRNAVKPYKIPIRLWSTVVIQLQNPVVAVGRRSRPPLPPSAGRLPLAQSARPPPPLPAPPPSRKQHRVPPPRLNLPLSQRGVPPHPGARLDRLRVPEPSLEI